MVRFYLETFGCALNSADSDIIVGRLNELGAIRSKTPSRADIIIINTCGVKEPTEDRIIHRIKVLRQLDKPLIITGCLPKIAFDRVKSAIRGAGAILGPQSVDALGSIFFRVLDGERNIVQLTPDSVSKLRFYSAPSNSAICTVPICEGCLGNCAYCAVKFARSEVRSYRIDEIFTVVEQCVHLGFREIRITSQDAGVYGYDTGETLVDLLDKLDTISGTHRFRLGMFNPNMVREYLPNLLEIMKSDHFFKFFHVPLQSGSNRILRLMKRKYTVEEWSSMITKIKTEFPKGTISTDIIVGFPGETTEDFEATMQILRDTRPTLVNISKYGDRPNTVASQSKEKVDTLVKKNRSRKLSRLVSSLTTEEHRNWIGWIGPALVTDEAPKSGYVCRNPSYKFIVVNEPLKIGDLVQVKIVDSSKSYLIGITIPLD